MANIWSYLITCKKLNEMKAYYIYPETIGCFDEYDVKWVNLCKVMGYNSPQKSLLVIPIETNQ